ncbi:MAG: Hpt domain-containing protein [Aliishimia sp.]
MIYWPKVIELRDEVGAEDFEEVVELFLDEVEETIGNLGVPGRSLEHDLHFLKGSALNLGFTEFSDLCQVGETNASNGAVDSIDTNAIIASYHASKSAFLADTENRLTG